MKTLIVLSALLPAGLIAAFLGTPVVRQEDGAKKKQRIEVRAKEGGGPAAHKLLSTSPRVKGGVLAPVSGGPSDHPTRKALNKLRKAETDSDKQSAREELAEALGEEFDRHLDQQAKELEQLEERLNKLRSQWEKRRDAKDEIVALRLQSLENDVNGLGWPSGGTGGPGVWHEGPHMLHVPPAGDHLLFRGTLAEPPMIPPQPGYRFSIETDVEDTIELVPDIDEEQEEDDDAEVDERVRYDWTPPPQPGR